MALRVISEFRCSLFGKGPLLVAVEPKPPKPKSQTVDKPMFGLRNHDLPPTYESRQNGYVRYTNVFP